MHNGVLTRKEILELDDLPTRRIRVPEWRNTEVIIRSMTCDERDQWEQKVKGLSAHDILCQIAIDMCVDENGARLFTQDDLPLLRKKNANALMRIGQHCARFNKLTDEDLKDLEGNSSPPAPPASGAASGSS